MVVRKLKENLSQYLFSIKQEFEHGEAPSLDGATLQALYEHGIFYRSMLDDETICNDGVLNSISGFCKLIESQLPAPKIKNDMVFSAELIKGNKNLDGVNVSIDLREDAVNLFKVVVIDLISSLQMAVIDLSAMLKTTNVLLPKDVDNVNYIVGMAEITSMNLGMVIEKSNDFDTFNSREIHKFLTDAVRFSNSLRMQGFGFVG